MTVDYETIISTDLSGLSKAASAWKRMGDRFGELHDDYRDHVKAAVESDNWQGESVLSYRGQAKVTLEEYAGARDEARAVGKLLKEAHSTLKSRRQRVLDIRNEAEQAGMDVDVHGRCTMNLSKLEGKKEAETYRRNTLARQEAEDSWTAKIAKAVKDVQDADSNIAKALMANPDDGGNGLRDGFNGALKGDVGEANAERASELYQKVRKGGKLSVKESEELKLLMEQNERDQEFSRTLISSLGGADGVIRMHNELTDRAYYDETGQKKHYLGLEKHLANVVSTATTVDKKDTAADKEFYDTWRKQMREAGLGKYDAEVVGGEYGGQQVRGYQALVTLMRNGSGYDEDFLHDLADDIRAAEDPKKGGDPDIWDLDGNFAGKQKEDGTFSRSGRGWFANDPYDGVLGIMSKNPDTATAYFDPDTAEGKYLQEDRDWKVVNRHEWGGNANTVHAEEDIDSRTGFGAALEAAMTGHVPGAEPDTDKPTHHSRAQVRVLEEVVKSYELLPRDALYESFLESVKPMLGCSS